MASPTNDRLSSRSILIKEGIYAFSGAMSHTGESRHRDVRAMESVDARGFGAVGRSEHRLGGGRRRTDSNATIANGNRPTDFDGYSITWDDAGRLISKTGNGISQDLYWSASGRLDSVETDGQMVRYEYNAFGQRVEKDGPSGTTGYVWDGRSLIATTDGSGSVTAKFSYLPGIDKPHSMRRNGTTYYYGLDHLGGVWGMIQGGGTVTNTYHYDPWGNVQNSQESVENPLQFTGREWDAGPGLLYLRNRYCDPSIARFTSQDPIGLSGGINPYVYAANSPVRFTDPFGLDPCDPGKDPNCEPIPVGDLFVNAEPQSAPPPLRFYGSGAPGGGLSAAGMAALGPGGPVVAGNGVAQDTSEDEQIGMIIEQDSLTCDFKSVATYAADRGLVMGVATGIGWGTIGVASGLAIASPGGPPTQVPAGVVGGVSGWALGSLSGFVSGFEGGLMLGGYKACLAGE